MLRILIGILAILLAPTFAQAQSELPLSPKIKPTILFKPQFDLATWHKADVSVTGAVNEVRGAMEDNRALSPVAALSSFYLKFENGDHKLRRIAVLAEDQFARFSMADQDSNDPFSADAMWAVISGGTQHSVSGFGSGTVHFPLEGGAPGLTPVLTGFDIERDPGTDANIRTFSIWFEEDENGAPVARVSFIDDQGEDFRGLAETALAATTLSLIPTGEIVNSHVFGVDAISRFAQDGRPRLFAATIQYAWIPDYLVETEGAAGGNDRITDSRPRYDRTFSVDGMSALQGFYFHFANEDHHLLELGVDPYRQDHPSNVNRGLLEQNGVFFRDGNFDDPVQWEVKYVTLNYDHIEDQ